MNILNIYDASLHVSIVHHFVVKNKEDIFVKLGRGMYNFRSKYLLVWSGFILYSFTCSGRAMAESGFTIPSQQDPAGVYYNKTAYEPQYTEIDSINGDNPVETIEMQDIETREDEPRVEAGYTEPVFHQNDERNDKCCTTVVIIIVAIFITIIAVVLLLSLFDGKIYVLRKFLIKIL